MALIVVWAKWSHAKTRRREGGLFSGAILSAHPAGVAETTIKANEMNTAILTGLVVGTGYGYIAHRGQCWLSSGFRRLLVKREATKIRASL